MKTDLLFFDADTLSSFLHLSEEYILSMLYEGRIIIPRSVYEEISRASFDNYVLKTRLDSLIREGKAEKLSINVDSDEYEMYQNLMSGNNEFNIAIGKGEASCITLAFHNKGIVVSNNLRDVSRIVEQYQLRHKTTSSILAEAYQKSIISEEYGNDVWARMKEEGHLIGPYESFSEYLDECGR